MPRLACIFQGDKLAVDATLAEAWSHDYAVKTAQQLLDIALVELLGVDVAQVELVVIICGSV